MLNLFDRLSNPGHAEFVNRTQLGQANGHVTTAIRPVGPADLAALSDFFAGLSVESRYLRFFAPVTPAYGLLHLLSGGPANVDAMVAVADGVIVGHAMAADRARGPRGGLTTDIGVVVADALAGPGRGRGADARADHPGSGPRRDVAGDGRAAQQPAGARHDHRPLAGYGRRRFPGLP